MDSCAFWSFHEVSLYGCSRTCEWASIRPGISVKPARSIAFASAGTLASAAGPADTIEAPLTTTTHPGWTESPSNTWAGFNTYTVGAGFGVGCGVCAESCATTKQIRAR